jgi:vacuolar-type H+-ATPase subunit I/STV1
MKINYAKELNEAHKNNLKEDILQVLNENFIETILDMINQNVQEALKKFQDHKNRQFEKAKEEIKKTIEALYKHQSGTENMMNKWINELRTKIANIKRNDTGYGKPQKKEQNRIAKQNGSPIQQNRTNRRQNLRTQR